MTDDAFLYQEEHGDIEEPIELKPCKHMILDPLRFPRLKLVDVCAGVHKSVKSWYREDIGCDGSHYCQFCDKGNRRIPGAYGCYGNEYCYEASE